MTIDATSTIEARGLYVTLRGEEHWKYAETTTERRDVDDPRPFELPVPPPCR